MALTGALTDPGSGKVGVGVGVGAVAVGAVAVSAAGTWLVTGDSDGSTCLWKAG